jgi:hypothetical protein
MRLQPSIMMPVVLSWKVLSDDLAIVDLLQQQPIRTGPTVGQEAVAAHGDLLAEHHGHAGPVVLEMVVLVRITVTEHEVQPVAQIVQGGIADDVRVRHELEVDAVAVVLDPVVADGGIAAFPQVDAIGHEVLRTRLAQHSIALDPRILDTAEVDREEALVQEIVFDHHATAFVHLDARHVVQITPAGATDGEALYRHMIGSDQQRVILPTAVDHCIGAAQQYQRSVHPDAAFAHSAFHQHGIARSSSVDHGLQRSTGTAAIPPRSGTHMRYAQAGQ